MFPRIWVSLAVFSAVVIVSTSPLGYLSIKVACNEDGDLRVHKTVDVPGYFYENHSNTCLICEEDVLSGRFEYVDAKLRYKHKLSDTNGFHRYSLAPPDAPECKRWQESVSYESMRKKYSDQKGCLTLQPIDAPTAYSFSFRRESVPGPFATELWLTELKIANTDTSTTLGTFRNYGYVAWPSDVFFGKPRYRWRCQNIVYDDPMGNIRVDILRGSASRTKQ